jgi:type II secretory pathway pseudopilin PulG
MAALTGTPAPAAAPASAPAGTPQPMSPPGQSDARGTEVFDPNAAALKYQQEQDALDQQRQNSAAAEAERQRRMLADSYASGRKGILDSTTSAIDTAFSGFSDDMFNNFATDYTSYYTPQVGYQYNDALKKLDLKYAGAGTGNSAYETDLQLLAKRKTDQEQKVKDDAKAAADAYRSTVQKERQSLLGDMLKPDIAGSETLPDDVSNVDSVLTGIKSRLSPFSTMAQNKAKAITRPAYTAMADIFGDLTAGYAGSGATAAADNINFEGAGLYQPNSGAAARVVI